MILVLNPYGIGNTVLQLPFYMNLRLQYPNKVITLIIFNPIVKSLVSEYVDYIYVFNRQSKGLKYFYEIWKLYIFIIKKNIYAVYILNFFGIKEFLLILLSGSKYKYAICNDSILDFLLSKKIKKIDGDHEVNWWLQFNDIVVYKKPTLQNSNANIINLNRKNIIGIHPGCSNFLSEKRWEINNYIELANKLSCRFDVIFFGGPDDIELFDPIDKKCPSCINLINKLSLEKTIDQISKCDIFVSNDSGLMHIAAALDIKVVALFGPSNEIKNAPYNNKSIVIRKSEYCVNSIKVDDVYDLINI